MSQLIIGKQQGDLKNKMPSPFFTSVKMIALLSVLLLGACAGSSTYMRDVAPEKANYTSQKDKALLVFMRPSGFAFAIQSSVFQIIDGNPSFLGILSAKTKIARHVNPGKTRFMVIGESADFMDATLEAGKIYYSLVTPRMGLWKARFSLQPVHGADVQTEEFASWYQDTRWVENLETASSWADSHMANIRGKMIENLPKWRQKADKPTLALGDGHGKPYGP